MSHPIQYFTPLWQELSRRSSVRLKVFYYSRQGLDVSFDPGFARTMAWDMDMLAAHDSEFLARQWPTRDPLDYSATALNQRIFRTLRQGWDAVFISGYSHINNLRVIAGCRALDIPVLLYADSNLHGEIGKPAWKLAVKRLALGALFRNISAFLAPGDQTRAYFVRYGAAPQAVFPCPFVVDIEGFRKHVQNEGSLGAAAMRSRLGIPPGKRIVAFGGKLVWWKRPIDVIRAIELLARNDTIALFIGDGPMREEVARAGGPLAVIAGFMNRSAIPLALSLADVLVLPSEIEPFGLIVSEAQVLGIPCVVSDRCGCYGGEAVLRDGESGFVYPCGDVEALAGILRRLLDDKSLYQRMSEAARRRGDLQSAAHAADGILAAATYATEIPRGRAEGPSRK